MNNKVLSEKDLDEIENEINNIKEEISWLDPNVPGEESRLSAHMLRLEELEKILLTSIKNHRIQKSGLRVVQ